MEYEEIYKDQDKIHQFYHTSPFWYIIDTDTIRPHPLLFVDNLEVSLIGDSITDK